MLDNIVKGEIHYEKHHIWKHTAAFAAAMTIVTAMPGISGFAADAAASPAGMQEEEAYASVLTAF